jgi:hypothetical protein
VTHEAALQALAVITDAARSLGITVEDLPLPEFSVEGGVGAAVRWSENEYSIISVPESMEFKAYLTGGVLWDLKHNDKLALLEACNDINSEIVTPTVYLHDGKNVGMPNGENAGWSILRQVQFPVQIVFDAPPFFEHALLREMSTGPQETRQALAEQGITGRPWTWDAASVKNLLSNSLF